MNYPQIKSTLFKALREAGSLMKEAIDRPKDIQKKSELSLVTETDCACEKAIIAAVQKDFPDHAFLTEESPAFGNSPSRWIVDPVDGTTNFAHGYPVSCVSIGFEHEGVVRMGGVYDPFRDELFFAEKGKGAFKNDKPIRVSQVKKLSESLIATGFPYDVRENADYYLATFKDFLMTTQGIRRAGAAAIDLCYVACGRYDAFYEKNLQPWDKAAGMLIVEEAGGRVTNYTGKPLGLNDHGNLATNGLLHAEMIEILKKTT
ncbi:MAG TPA: inositol monophosphatase family protein [Verrucomicrobiae bacterium]|jgi:myo-inositol-1(or 4)-monophosphatase|nr:inositol monophosphatase family protein [Verrucomicrobiae bacterium]